MSDHEPYELCCSEHYPLPVSAKSANEHLVEAVAKILERDGYTVSTETPSCQSMPFATVGETEHPMYLYTVVNGKPVTAIVLSDADELLRLRTENEQLRALLARSLSLMAPMCHTIEEEYNHCNQSYEIDEIREQAKMLGVEVQA